MTGKTVYQVRLDGDLWRIELAGDSVTEFATTRAAAIERAKVLARRAPRGGVVVLDRDGKVELELELDKSATR